jgi:Serine dehydrogenase proteinase
MPHRIPKLAEAVRDKYDADILLYVGTIARPKDDFLIDECVKKKKRKNILLCISTYGGDAHAAYRIARTLQRYYGKGHAHAKGDGKVYAFVNCVCWSAGTLLVMGADELILSDHAELGPIDVQLKKTEEIGEIVSGLTPIQAMEYLQGQSEEMFVRMFNSMRFGGGFSTAAASKIASDLASGLLGKLYEQIDPLRVAEIYRFLNIAEHYGQRIGRNLKAGALQKLLYEYPAHNCVIDSGEARTLFETVSEPTSELDELGEILKQQTQSYLVGNDARVCYLEEEEKQSTPAKDEKHKHKNGKTEPTEAKPATPFEPQAKASVRRR